jgi:hypothetical protein
LRSANIRKLAKDHKGYGTANIRKLTKDHKGYASAANETGGRSIQVYLISNALYREVEIKVTKYKLMINRCGH